MVPTLFGSSQIPKWKFALIGSCFAVVLLVWFYLFAVDKTDTVLYNAIWICAFVLIFLVGLWMIWRGGRGLKRAKHLRQHGIELDAELLEIRKKTVHHLKAQTDEVSSFKGRKSTSHLEFVDYSFNFDGAAMNVRDAPLLIGKGAKLGRVPSTVHIQVDPNDPANNRLMATPSHVTYIMRSLQLLCGCALDTVIVIATFSPSLLF